MDFDGQYDKIRLDSSPTNKEMFHMNQESHYQNLQLQLHDTMTQLDKMISQLKSAKQWSWVDLLEAIFSQVWLSAKK